MTSTNQYKTLKHYIYTNQLVISVLEALSLQNIKEAQGGKLITAQEPNSSNSRAIQVYNNPSLSSHIRNRGISGDIFTVVEYMRDADLIEAYNIICKIIGYSDEIQIEEYYDVNSWLHEIRKERRMYGNNRVLDKSILDYYIKLPSYEWYKEGLIFETQKEFDVGLDLQTNRIVFPIYNQYGELINIKGRATDNNEDAGNPKYMYLLQPFYKSAELFNQHRAEPHIKAKKEIIVVEGAKTVMFLHQWGYKNSVSIEGKTISQLQAHKILKTDARIVLAFDKDVGVDEIRKQTKTFGEKKVQAIVDINGLLEEKDSPIDRGMETWQTLWQKNKYIVR